MKYISLLIVSFALAVSPTSLASSKGQKGKKEEKIVGTVIAQYTFMPPCVWHPCYVWLIVRAHDNNQKQARYIQVTVEYFPTRSLPKRGFPSELVEKAQEWQFAAERDIEPDKVVEKYLKMIDSETGKDEGEEMGALAWALLPGAEKERIPFGEVVPYYYVKANRYKPQDNR
jgi:hypothetical protein